MSKRKISIDRALELIERDHGGCDSNTCTLNVALREGFNLIAIDSWLNSGAASSEFDNGVSGYTKAELRAEVKCFVADTPHVTCPHCNSVLWYPDETDYFCDDCLKKIPHDAGSESDYV